MRDVRPAYRADVPVRLRGGVMDFDRKAASFFLVAALALIAAGHFFDHRLNGAVPMALAWAAWFRAAPRDNK